MLKSVFGSLRRQQQAVPPQAAPPPALPLAAQSAFFNRLMEKFFAHLAEFEPDNYDYERFGVTPGTPMGANTRPSFLWFQIMQEHIGRLEQARNLFEDQASRDLYEDLLLYRLLLHPHMRLPVNNERHWALREKARDYRSGPSDFGAFSKSLHRFGIDFMGHHIDLQCADASIAWAFLLRQYYFERNGVSVQVEPGDIVIDAGACFGDTALGFAAAAGPQGRVFAFDIMPMHLEIIRANFAANPDLSPRLEAVQAALGDIEGQLYIHGSGPGAYIDPAPSERIATVTTIDSFVAARRLPRVDFIKMDIEGAEGPALRGAIETIRRHQPKLAISLYHGATDIFDLPLLIDSIGVDYAYYLDHYTIHVEETVLYAIPRR